MDVFGILRGKYWSPAFAIKIGESAIRNCFRDQLSAIQKEGMDYMGPRPCVFTEIGIPYDMDDKHAYKTGDYSSQVAAMDANHYALEGSNVAGFTLWTYVATVRTSPFFKPHCVLTSFRMIISGETDGTARIYRYILKRINPFLFRHFRGTNRPHPSIRSHHRSLRVNRWRRQVFLLPP